MDNSFSGYGTNLPPSASTPVCPRHPDRESRITCQRCSRPVCPECQRPAAVGVHCVDCVAESAAKAPVYRTIYGAHVRQGKPVVTISIIGICVVAWLLQQVPSLNITELGFFSPIYGLTEPWRFITAAFLHAPQPWHILFNMLCLWIMGNMLEPAIGRARFLVSYLLCAVGGSVGFMWFSASVTSASSTWMSAAVGASGAVFGLFGMALVISKNAGLEVSGVFGFILINALLPVFFPSIAWQAHLGGFLTGLLAGGALILYRRKQSAAVQWGALTGVGVLLVVLAVLKYGLVIAGIGI